MQRYSRPFVKALRRHVLSALKSQPALRKEYKLRRQRISVTKTQVYLTLLLVVFCVFFWNLAVNETRPDFPYIFVALYATGTVVLRSSSLCARLEGPEAAMFATLPVADSDFFRLQWARFLLYSSWVFVTVLVAYLSHALHGEISFLHALWPSLLCALAQWTAVIVLALALLKFQRASLSWAAMAVYFCVPVIFIRPELGKFVLPVTFFLPAGWINQAHSLLLAGRGAGFLWLLPSLAIALSGLFLLPRRRSSFNLCPKEIKSFGLGNEPEIQETERPSAPLPAGAAAGSQRLLAPDWMSSGWLERISGAWLGDDKPIAELMTGQRLGVWSSHWQKALYLTAAVTVLYLLVPAVRSWIGVLALIGPALYASPILGGHWLGFASVRMGMRVSFVAACYPVDYWRVSKVILKVNAVRLLAGSLLLVPAITLAGPALGLTVQQAGLLALRMIILAFILQFPAIAMLHSQGTNDTRRLSLPVLGLIIFAGIYIIGVFIAIFTLLLPDLPRGWLIAGLGLAASSILAWWLYGLLYSGNRIDLLHDPKS